MNGTDIYVSKLSYIKRPYILCDQYPHNPAYCNSLRKGVTHFSHRYDDEAFVNGYFTQKAPRRLLKYATYCI